MKRFKDVTRAQLRGTEASRRCVYTTRHNVHQNAVMGTINTCLGYKAASKTEDTLFEGKLVMIWGFVDGAL